MISSSRWLGPGRARAVLGCGRTFWHAAPEQSSPTHPASHSHIWLSGLHTPCSEQHARAVEGELAERAGRREAVDDAAGGEVPERHLAVLVARGGEVAVGRGGDVAHRRVVPAEQPRAPPLRDVPQPDRLVVRRG